MVISVISRLISEEMVIVSLPYPHILMEAALETNVLKGGGAFSVDSAFTSGSNHSRGLKKKTFSGEVSWTKT